MREVCTWEYRRPDRSLIGFTRRYEDANGTKQIIPHFGIDSAKGIPDSLAPEDRLFGLDTITDFAQPILIVEGEKCAHALHGLGYQAVTSLGGCGQMLLADWTPLERAQRIFILPDFDRAGAQYAAHVYRQVKDLPELASVELVPFRIGDKADICDFLKRLPELSDWDELESLADHPARPDIARALERYISGHAEPIPVEWRFIVTPSKHKLISANDFGRIELPRRQMLLAPWLTEGSINMVFADRGIGKTFFCLSCAVALANGEKFLCYDAPEAAPLLYLDGEMQAVAMQERLRQLTQSKPTQAPLSIFTPDCQDLTDHTPDLGIRLGRSEIDQLVKAARPKVVFIDNISTFVRTGNENEGDSWAPVQEWAVQLRKQGTAVVFVHHANKEGKQRGSHKKEDVMDVVIQLKRPDDFIQGTDDTRLMIRYTKARHLPAAQATDIEATLKSVDGALEWSWEAGDLSFQRAVDLLRDGLSMAEIADELGVSKSTVHRWKKKANGQGEL